MGVCRNYGNGAMTLLSLEGVSVGYNHKPLVQNITGTLESGDMVAIVGDNGQGKSTLLKTFMREHAVFSGRMVWHKSLKIQDKGYLSQTSRAGRDFPLTVVELVTMGAWGSLGLFQRVTTLIKQRVIVALEQVGLAEHSACLMHTLSGGQFQRALFARLMVQNPSVIFLDEPFNALDETTRLALQQVIIGWHKEGKTLMVVLHDWDFVRAVFPKVLLLEKGQMTGWGKTQDILPPVCAHPYHYQGVV
jgi:zinc/manganese transport system ATP-binding protein